MTFASHPKIRELLHQHPDGLTTLVMATLLGARRDTVQQALTKMPDVYIDRWELPRRGAFQAVWIAVKPPPHCPRPDKR